MAEAQAKKLLREYETVFLVKPDLTDDQVDQIKNKVRGIVDREGGKHLKFTIWGKKRTMYNIAKQPRAIYVHSSYLGNPGLVSEVERNLRNLEEVSRFLSVKVADDIDPEARPVLEDVKLAGDVEEVRPTGPERTEGTFRPREEREEAVSEVDEEAAEEA
jgi:small subunit ribosomal protein S6